MARFVIAFFPGWADEGRGVRRCGTPANQPLPSVRSCRAYGLPPAPFFHGAKYTQLHPLGIGMTSKCNQAAAPNEKIKDAIGQLGVNLR